MKNMYRICFFFLVLLAACKKDPASPPMPSDANNSIVETKPHILTPKSQRINAVIGGFYTGLPASYSITTKTYPTIVFIHGAGQFGEGAADIKKVLDSGIPKLLSTGSFPSNIAVGDSNYSFIVLVPQFSSTPTMQQVRDFVQFARQTYRINPSKLYMAGLSMGGLVSGEYAATYPSELAAIVTFSGAPTNQLSGKVSSIMSGNVGVWSFHNQTDPIFDTQFSIDFIAEFKKINPLYPATLTIFPVVNTHDSWTAACNPAFKEAGKNIYEFMLGFKQE